MSSLGASCWALTSLCLPSHPTCHPATPGMHYPESRYYIRRVRVPASSELLPPLRAAGYSVEPDTNDAMTAVVSIPVDVGENVRT